MKRNKLKVKFKQLHPEAKNPFRATPGSAGFDLYAVSKEQIDGCHTKYGTGLAVEIPPGYVGLVFPRSSCHKKGMLLSNCVGVIDSDFRGEITAVFLGTHREYCYNIGERICQMILLPYPDVEYVAAEELSETSRGTGGYGSTGNS